MTALRLAVLLTAFAAVLPAKTRNDIPLAPLPAKVLAAKKIFVVNVCQDDLAYDAVYAALKNWGRFEIVDSVDASDLIMEVGTVVYGSRVRVNNHAVLDEQLVLTVLDSVSKGPLWETAERCGFAIRQKKREKATIDAAERMIDSLKARMIP